MAPGVDLTELGPDCYSLHGADGRAYYVNSNARGLFGCRPEDLMDAGFLAQIHVQDRVAAARAIRPNQPRASGLCNGVVNAHSYCSLYLRTT